MTRKRGSRNFHGRSSRLLKQPTDPLTLASIPQLIKYLGISQNGWDAIIIGDGSGSDWRSPCGWSAVLHDRLSNLRKEFHGASNVGTSYIGELMPYIISLLWYSRHLGKERIHSRVAMTPSAKALIHIVTDSAILASQGNGLASRHKNRELWSVIESLSARGYDVTWYWVGRDKLGLNRLTDHLSRLSRRAITSIGHVAPPAGTTIYDFNPPELEPSANGHESNRILSQRTKDP